VIAGCGDRNEGTWITPAMRRAYERLHALGWVHSVEVWEGTALVGGVYGVAIDRFFAAESKFHRAPDASKVALAELVEWLGTEGFQLLDVQLATAHLRRRDPTRGVSATSRARGGRSATRIRMTSALLVRPITAW
jgi:leucyl/phenylalanyl-tRNA---protein transferase